MARPPRPERKSELMHDILLYLQDKSIADLTFRTLAEGLGISSYVLVYHFGSREELISQIVHAIEARPAEVLDPEMVKADRDEFAAWLWNAWKIGLREYGMQLQRLHFEAAMQDAVLEAPRGNGGALFTSWVEAVHEWLVNQGLKDEAAWRSARLFVAALTGLRYGVVVTGDRDGATESFDRLLKSFFLTIDAELAQQG
ncbi:MULTISPECIES: TetR/AcrR family transcriptional regulator [Arthrobacter]|uniref:TetR/AcrR family transcriptional regulator n=2 Tax=Arthrobacter TaxID=1663 RepID=A0ABU9KMF7_9MICC|nr:TetR/AcrR family transcriptional regulator [Arthrobacter sp. YJM1]MDP5227992.1 TetR/AcrR family transcriptional regulator [Arthrobacter sp. YJM1]